MTFPVTKVSFEAPTTLAGQCRLPLPTLLLAEYGREDNPVSFFIRVCALPSGFLVDILVSSVFWADHVSHFSSQPKDVYLHLGQPLKTLWTKAYSTACVGCSGAGDQQVEA